MAKQQISVPLDEEHVEYIRQRASAEERSQAHRGAARHAGVKRRAGKSV
jgi:hypothetical protein